MRKSEKNQKLADDAKLLRQWRAWHREQLEEALAGRHGATVARVIEFLKHMKPSSAPELIALLHEFDWSQMDAEVRFVCLHEINSAITKLRERAGLDPIDDALPDQRANAFLVIKEHLFPQKRESPPDGSGKPNGDSYERYNNETPSPD
jgi:hypothetical protein